MDEPFRCGHFREPDNTMYEYGYQRCRTCKRRSNLRAQRRQRQRYKDQYGFSVTYPNAA